MIKNYVKENKKLVALGSSFRIEYGDPFKCSSTFPTQKLFFGGWLTNSPLNKGKFDTFNFFVNGYGIFLNSKKKRTIDLISKSIFNKSRIKVTPSVILNKQNNSIIELK